MDVDPPGDPLGPQELECVFCWPLRDPTTGEVLRDENGDALRHCELCIARGSDRWCECTYCPWLDDGGGTDDDTR